MPNLGYAFRMQLSRARRDIPLRVTGVRTQDPSLDRRLAELGLRPGATVIVLRWTSGRGAIVAIADDRLALSHEVLTAIAVTDTQAVPA